MLDMIRSLFGHQEWADNELLKSVRVFESASRDEAMRWTLHHTVMVQRGFLALILGREFDLQKAALVPATFAGIAESYSESHRGDPGLLVPRPQPADF